MGHGFIWRIVNQEHWSDCLVDDWFWHDEDRVIVRAGIILCVELFLAAVELDLAVGSSYTGYNCGRGFGGSSNIE